MTGFAQQEIPPGQLRPNTPCASMYPRLATIVHHFHNRSLGLKVICSSPPFRPLIQVVFTQKYETASPQLKTKENFQNSFDLLSLATTL